jgi:hypothetical protein
MGWKQNKFETEWFNQRLQRPIYDKLKSLATEQGRSMASVCQEALREHFGLPKFPYQDMTKGRPKAKAKTTVDRPKRRLPLQ